MASAEAPAEAEPEAESLEETQPASRRRLDSFVPAARDAVLELAGEPLSTAEMASAIMRAKGTFRQSSLQCSSIG